MTPGAEWGERRRDRLAHRATSGSLPRLKNIASIRLYRPNAGPAPPGRPGLGVSLTRPIHRELTARPYDPMVTYSTTLRVGTAEAEQNVQRIHSRRPPALHRPGPRRTGPGRYAPSSPVTPLCRSRPAARHPPRPLGRGETEQRKHRRRLRQDGTLTRPGRRTRRSPEARPLLRSSAASPLPINTRYGNRASPNRPWATKLSAQDRRA
ncbi:Tn3 family transposase [Streptomyces sp. FIT100]|nr:Tn3 family transposase [Streptomyces sp. FIT100]